MGKVYKGYELYKMIADREIKKDSKFKDNNNIIWVWDGLDFVTEECDYNDFVFSLIDFELLEDEKINIQAIEETEFKKDGSMMYYEYENNGNTESGYSKDHSYNDIDTRRRINELVQAVKQLDNKIKNN